MDALPQLSCASHCLPVCPATSWSLAQPSVPLTACLCVRLSQHSPALCLSLPVCPAPPAPSRSLAQPSCAPCHPPSSQSHRNTTLSLPQPISVALTPSSPSPVLPKQRKRCDTSKGRGSGTQAPVLSGADGWGRWAGAVPVPEQFQLKDSAGHPLPPTPYRCSKLHREESASLLSDLS